MVCFLFVLEQVTRIELAYSAWKAEVLPLNYTCVVSGDNYTTLTQIFNFYLPRNFKSMGFGMNPKRVSTTFPSLNNNKVGID